VEVCCKYTKKCPDIKLADGNTSPFSRISPAKVAVGSVSEEGENVQMPGIRRATSSKSVKAG
jgi:hypothetical protein